MTGEILSYSVFKGLFEIWKQRNFDIHFYLDEIFDKSREALTQRTREQGISLSEGEEPRYRGLFVPVGFSIENVALIAAVLKPTYLRLAFTEVSKRFHREHVHLVEEKIKRVYPNLSTTHELLVSDDRQYTEDKIMEWVEEMKKAYGLASRQMAIDLTGGTKPISIGAYSAALLFDDIDAFYLRTEYDEETQEPLPGTETLVSVKHSVFDDNMVFVLMPFEGKYDVIYEWVSEAVRDLGIKCLRADKEIFMGGIMERIKRNIVRAGILIAELTECNLNVYYELGLSHGFNKKVIMLTQKIDSVPFDLRHLRMVVYDPKDKSKFIEQLSEEVRSVKAGGSRE